MTGPAIVTRRFRLRPRPEVLGRFACIGAHVRGEQRIVTDLGPSVSEVACARGLSAAFSSDEIDAILSGEE